MSSTRRSRRVQPGDVFELALRNGRVYLQTLGKHITHGWAVRVLTPNPDSDLGSTVRGPELYVFLIGDIAFEEREGRVRYIGRAQLPSSYNGTLPTFRASADYLPDGRHKPDSWWLDNGKDEWKVGTLSPEQQHYPYRQITPALAVRDLVERGWDPEWEFKGADAKEFREPTQAQERSPHTPVSTFFLYFRTAGDATHAREQIVRERPLFTSADVDSNDDADDTAHHSLILKTSANFDLTDLEHFLETVADRFGGVYDGNELPLRP